MRPPEPVVDAATQLTYLHRPPQTDAGAPILVLLHGVGSNERNLWPLTAQIDPRFRVLSLRSAFQHGPDAYGWYRIQFTPQGPVIDGHEALASRAMLLRFLRALPERYGISADQIFLFGFSQGCSMSYAVALTEPETIGGLIGLGGRILPETEADACAPNRLARLRAFVAHGAQDPVIPVEKARAARRYLESSGVELEYREYPAGHLIADVAAADALRWLHATVLPSTTQAMA